MRLSLTISDDKNKGGYISQIYFLLEKKHVRKFEVRKQQQSALKMMTLNK